MFYLQITTVLIYGACLVISAFLLMCLMLLICDKPYPNYKRHQKEKYFKDYRSGEDVEFPSLDDSPTVNLSVVVPAFDEEVRLPPMLDECILFLENKVKDNKNFSYEIIIVSDGSRDKTVAVASEYSKKHGADKVRVLDLTENRGKGGAVRLGVMSARGALILFADADGATRFSDFSKLEGSLTKYCGKNYITEPQVAAEKSAIAIGSRAHLEDESIATRSMFRTVLMYGFHFLVWLFAVRGVRDTQCGFKVFTRQAARICFTNMHVERWAFDVELLYIAQHYDIPIAEEAVYWTEIDGSKVTPLWSWLQMGGDLGLIYLRYRIGAWKLKKAE